MFTQATKYLHKFDLWFDWTQKSSVPPSVRFVESAAPKVLLNLLAMAVGLLVGIACALTGVCVCVSV